MKFKTVSMNLLMFSLVPLSQILLYTKVSPILETNKSLINMQNVMKMTSFQMSIFEILIILFYSIVSFIFIYYVYFFVLKMIDHLNQNALFMSLVLAIGLSNILTLIYITIFEHASGIFTAVFQILFFMLFYYQISKDKKPLLVILVFGTFFNVIPSFLF